MKPDNHTNSKSDDFNKNLQDLIIRQARKLLNNHFFTKSLLSSLPVALIAVDQQGIIRIFNKSAEEILKTNSINAINKHITELFNGNSPVIQNLKTILKEGLPIHVSSEAMCLTSGTEIHGNIYMQPIFDDEQMQCGIVLSIEDLTYVNFLHHAFRRYVPPSVSESIARDPEKLILGGEIRNLSVLFSDIIGFSTISEQLPPDKIITLLSDYFDEMTEEIFRYEGTLKEYTGDEIMAIFGAPVNIGKHAKKACNTALSMQKKLKTTGKSVLEARIGINTGNMLVGNIGSKHRFSYGVIGDHVNLASRLEGLCSVYGVQILISESTALEIKSDFVLREVDHVRVKGRKKSVKLFELISKKGCEEKFKTRNGLYERALSEYRSGNFSTAARIFSNVTKDYPDDQPARVMANRCRLYIHTPPYPDPWEGIYDFNRNALI